MVEERPQTEKAAMLPFIKCSADETNGTVQDYNIRPKQPTKERIPSFQAL